MYRIPESITASSDPGDLGADAREVITADALRHLVRTWEDHPSQHADLYEYIRREVGHYPHLATWIAEAVADTVRALGWADERPPLGAYRTHVVLVSTYMHHLYGDGAAYLAPTESCRPAEESEGGPQIRIDPGVCDLGL